MPASPRPWIVMPHHPLRQVDVNLWTLQSVVPGIPGRNFPRTMSVVRRGDGTLLLHNAIPTDEPTMAQLAALGRITTIFLPSPFHCIDAHAMAARTGATVICPASARPAIEQVVKVDADTAALAGDPTVRFEPLAGVSNGEGVLLVRSDGRVSLLVCDVILAVSNLPGLWGLVWRFMGFTGRHGPSPLWRKRVMSDAGALAGSLERLAGEPGLRRIVPSHGPVLEDDPAGVLRRVAAALRR